MGSDLLDASGIQAIFLKMPFQKPRCHLSAPSSGTSQMTLRARKTVALHSLVESSGTSPVRESGDKATRTFTSNEMEILSASEYSSDEDAGAVRRTYLSLESMTLTLVFLTLNNLKVQALTRSKNI